MDKFMIIRDLLNWIERNLDSLDNRLSLDKVARKAGYSKWHLQRMFKDITGQAIGAYIRGRRLSKSAVALRLTSRSILDIALQYRFDSQQTFTRSFKKQFRVTPAVYRRSPEWNACGMRPPLNIGGYTPLTYQFITLPRTCLAGVTQSYTCSLEQISDCRLAMRTQFWKNFLGNTSTLPPLLYGLHEAHPSKEKLDEQEVFYTTALLRDVAHNYTQGISGIRPIELDGGDYVKFVYQGQKEGLQEFVMTLYGSCMPELNLIRRKSPDIELFYPKSENYDPQSKTDIHCEYLIPVHR